MMVTSMAFANARSLLTVIYIQEGEPPIARDWTPNTSKRIDPAQFTNSNIYPITF